jgi:hypothetical protein
MRENSGTSKDVPSCAPSQQALRLIKESLGSSHDDGEGGAGEMR